MSKARRNAALLLAGLVVLLAIGLRYESARHTITGLASRCAISEHVDCDKVQASSYASFLGLPLSIWAAAGHAILIVWLLAGKLVAAGVLALSNLLVALFLAYVSFFELNAVCPYCSAMQACIVALAFVLIPPARKVQKRQGGLGLAGMTAALCVGLAFAGEAYASQRAELLRLFEPGETAKERVDVWHSPILGDPATRHSGMLYLDFGCPHCYECFRGALKAVATYPRSIHFIIKHYPLDHCNLYEKGTVVHPGACEAAWASVAATIKGDDDLFALRYLFDQQSFYPQVLDDLGKRIGVPRTEWRMLIKGEQAKLPVQRDMDDAHKLKIAAVPRAYIDGRVVDAHRLPQVVQKLLGR